MSNARQYFSIPFDLVPMTLPPSCTVWFAAWSNTPPVIEPGMKPPLVIGVTEDALPPGAIALGTGAKDPPPPPPPLAGTNISDYYEIVGQWLQTSRDADE